MPDLALRFLLANLAAAIAVVLVLLLRKPALRLFGARLAYALWLLVPLAAVGSLLPRVIEVVVPSPPIDSATIFQPPSVFDAAPPAPTTTEAAVAIPVSTSLSIDAWTVGWLAWLAGALVMAGWLAYGQSRFLSDARRSKAGPAVVGLLRPRIVVPSDFEARFEPKERDVILAHEKIHLSRNDARINGLVAVIRCICWFNPLIHVAAYFARIDQELACDATVAERHPKAKAVYASALLKAQLAMRPLPLGCYWPAGTEHPLTERIEMLKQAAPGRARRMVGAGALAVLAVGAGVSAWAAMPAEEHFVDAPVPLQATANDATHSLQPNSMTGVASILPEPAADEPSPQSIRKYPDRTPASSAQDVHDTDFDTSNPIHLRGKVERIDFGEKTYVAFVRASSIAACPDGPGQQQTQRQADTRLWELAPMPYWGNRDAVTRDLMNQDVYVRGFNAKDKSCTPNCRMLARGVFKGSGLAAFSDPALTCKAGPQPNLYKPQPAPPVPSAAPAADGWRPFAATFDADDPVMLNGVIERIESRGVIPILIVRPTGISPGKDGLARRTDRPWRVEGGREMPAEIRERLAPGRTVSVRGYNAKDKSCEPTCLMAGRDVVLLLANDAPTPQVAPQPIQYQQQPPSMPAFPVPIAGVFMSNSPIRLETDTPVRLRGKVERIDFRDTSYVVFVRATGISRDFGAAPPGVPAYPKAYQPNAELWELSPTNYFGDRDAIRADLMGKNVELRGINVNDSCSPSCKIKLTELIMPQSTAVPPPAANASLVTQFGQWYDTTALSYVRGKVERVDFYERTFDAYIRSEARGAAPSLLVQVRSEYSFPRADVERALLNKTVTATGWRAREGLSTFCDPVCGLYATSFELPTGARISPTGQTLVSEPMPDAPAVFREAFDWNAPMTIEGKIIKVESGGAISGPNDRNLANAVWVETSSVDPASTPGATPGTIWRVVGGGLPLPEDQWIGHPVTASGYNAKDKTCTPTCSMSHGSMSVR